MPYLPHTSPDHDPTLIARLAADDFSADDRFRQQATQLVADCPACAELLADLRTIASATAELPAPRRTRDFRLTEADAARLRPTGWRGALARLGTPSFAFTRPLAAGLATLGIAGLLLASLPAGLGGSAASAPQTILAPAAGNAAGGSSSGAQDAAGENASAAPAPAYAQPGASGRDTVVAPDMPSITGGPSGRVGVTTDGSGSSKGSSSPGAALGAAPTSPTDGTAGRVTTQAEGGSSPGGPTPLSVVSIVLLLAGLGLWILRVAARRLA